MRPRSLGDWYELVFVGGFAAMALYALAHTFLPDLLEQVEQRGHAPGRVAVPLLCFTLGLWARAWYHVGPLAVSPERLQWWVWRREPSRWLRRQRFAVLGVGAALAGVVAAVSAPAFAGGGGPFAGGGAWVAALVVWGSLQLLTLACLYLQRRDLDGLARSLPLLLAGTGVVLAVGEAWNGATALAVAVGLALVLAGTRRGWGSGRPRGIRAELTPRWQLHRGARGRWALGAGAALLDHEVVRAAGQRDAPAGGKPLPACVYRPRWPVNLAVTVGARHLPRVLPAPALGLPLVLAVDRILGSLAALLVTVLWELLLTVVMVRGAEAWGASDALPRIWAATGARVTAALYLPAVAVCTVVTLVVSVGMALPWPAVLVLLALPVAVAARRRTARGGSDAVVLSTPAGAVPVHTANRLGAGPDVALLAWLLAGLLTSG